MPFSPGQGVKTARRPGDRDPVNKRSGERNPYETRGDPGEDPGHH